MPSGEHPFDGEMILNKNKNKNKAKSLYFGLSQTEQEKQTASARLGSQKETAMTSRMISERTENEPNSNSRGNHVPRTCKCLMSPCTVYSAVRAVTEDPCSMKRDWRSMLCALCMEIPRALS